MVNGAMILLYNILLLLALFIGAPYYAVVMLATGKYRQSLGAKFGLGTQPDMCNTDGHPRIWLHAVSVGEVTAAAPIVNALRAELPDACIVVSTSTETGQTMARNIIPQASAVIYYPLDLPWTVRKLLRRVRPDCFCPYGDGTVAELYRDLQSLGESRLSWSMAVFHRVPLNATMPPVFFWRSHSGILTKWA